MGTKSVLVRPSRGDVWGSRRLLGRIKRWRDVPGLMVKLQVAVGKKPGRTVRLSRGVQRVMLLAMKEFRQGRAVTLLPVGTMLTTGEVAKYLRVSRPFVVKEIMAGRLKGEMVGTHRRVKEEALAEYVVRRRGARIENGK